MSYILDGVNMVSFVFLLLSIFGAVALCIVGVIASRHMTEGIFRNLVVIELWFILIAILTISGILITY